MEIKFRKSSFILPSLFLLSIVVQSETFNKSYFGIDFSLLILTSVNLIGMLLFIKSKKKITLIDVAIILVITFSIIQAILLNESIQAIRDVFFAGMLLMLLYTLPLLLPFRSLVDEDGIRITIILGLIIGFLWSRGLVLRNWNPNQMGYLLYFSVALIVHKVQDKKNLLVWLFVLVYIIYLLLNTGSRNAVLGIIVAFLIVLLKKQVIRKPLYYVLCNFAILYPFLFANYFLEYLKNNSIYNYLLKYTMQYFNKTSVFSGRDLIFELGNEILKSNTFNYLFGYGKNMVGYFPAHNNYILVAYLYGIVGCTILFFYFRNYFHTNYEEICIKSKFKYSLFAIIMGMFFQLGSEGYFVATRLLTLMPFIFFALIGIKRKEGKTNVDFDYYTNI